MAKRPVALQMYTLRDLSKEDFPGTLRQVAEIGYQGVELAGTYGLAADQLKRILDDLGLQVAGSHEGFGSLEKELNRVIEANLALGNRYVVCPALPGELRQSEEGFRRAAEVLGQAGAELRRHGLTLVYHNHDFEFVRFGDRYALDLLLGSTEPEVLQAELDVYWVKRGGEDPVAYLRKYAGRVPLVHLKDMAADRFFAEVGEGILDWPAILGACEEAGARWYVVEQDVCRRPPLESVRISLENLKRWGVV